MVAIEWTDEAIFWLKEIHDYIAQDNKKVAKRISKEIYNKVQILATFPKIGYVYKTEESREIRILLYGHYRIAYLVEEDLISILGVFHGALEIERYLK
jgi:addiction module RelE/StbE family toxin